MSKVNDYFGWVLKDNPNFWEDNGYTNIDVTNYHYFGCAIAKTNNYPVYEKQLWMNYALEEESCVRVFPFEVGSIKHIYLVSIYTWYRDGGSKFSLDIAKQVSSVKEFNEFIMENIGDDLENGSYLLKI